MLAQLFDLVSDLERRINGTPRISISRRDSALLLRCEWLISGNILRLEHSLSRIDIGKFKGEETYMLNVFVAKANHEYRKKIEQMIQEIRNAAKT